METKRESITISHREHEIPKDEFVMLPPNDMARRETIGKRLNRARLELGMSVPQLREKILQDHRAEIGESTIRDIEKDKTPNPGFKTLEFCALGVGLDPLEVISLGLDDPPELETGFRETQFAQLWKKYKRLNKEQRAFIDESVEMLIYKIGKWS